MHDVKPNPLPDRMDLPEDEVRIRFGIFFATTFGAVRTVIERCLLAPPGAGKRKRLHA